MIYQPQLDTQAGDSSQMTVYSTSKLHLPETLYNFKTTSVPFRNGNRLGWCSSILWHVKVFVSPTNRKLSLPLTSSMKGILENLKSAKYLGLVLWSTQRLSTFMSTQRISRHVDIIFNISTKEQWQNKMSIITWEAEMSYATTFN